MELRTTSLELVKPVLKVASVIVPSFVPVEKLTTLSLTVSNFKSSVARTLAESATASILEPPVAIVSFILLESSITRTISLGLSKGKVAVLLTFKPIVTSFFSKS